MKGKKPAQNTDINQKLSDNTQYLSFLYEDFLSKSAAKDGRSKLAIETKEFLTHATAQYKALLELPPLVFWSTVNHNAYLHRSLDSFLSYARRWHFCILDISSGNDNLDYADDLDYDTLQVKKHLHVYFNELYRVILCVYERLASDPLDKSIKDKIQYSEVIYQNWLFDIPKFLDICTLYSETSPDRVKKILENVFEIEDAYHSDYLDFIGELTDSTIPNNLKIINRHRKREDLDANTMTSDTEEKERILIVMYDIIYNLKLISMYFPKKCVEALYYDKKFLLILENTYMILNSCSKTWRVNAERQDLLRNLARRVNNTIFRVFERVYTSVFGSILLSGPNDKISKEKKLWSTVNDYLNQTGKTMSKKKEDEPNHKFLRKVMKYVDFGAILQKVPSGILKEEDIEGHQVLLMVLRERSDELRKKLGRDEEKEDKEQSPERNTDESQAAANASLIKEVPKEPKMEKKPSVVDKNAESTKEAIRIIEMSMGKKNKAFNVFEDEDAMRESMAATLKLAATTNVYEDDYDDTLEMYEEDRLRVGGDKADENLDDDEEDMNVEGGVKPEEGGKQGGRGPRGRRGDDKAPRNEGYRGGNQGRNYEDKGRGQGQDQRNKPEEERGGQEGYKYQSKGQEGHKYQGNRDDRGGYKGDRYQGDRYQGGDRYHGDKYQGDRYQGDRHQGDRYQGDKYQGDRYQGDRYQGDKHQGDRNQGDRYQGDKYQGDRYQGGHQGDRYQGDRYQGNKYEDNRGYGGNRNERAYQEKGKESHEDEGEFKSKRDRDFAAELQRGGGVSGPFDQKKQNRNAYNDNKKYKGGNKGGNKQEFVPKK